MSKPLIFGIWMSQIILDQTVLTAIDDVDCGFPVVRFYNVMPGLFEHRPHDFPDRRLISYYQHATIAR